MKTTAPTGETALLVARLPPAHPNTPASVIDHNHDVTVVLGAADEALQAALSAAGYVCLLITPASEMYVRERRPAQPTAPPPATTLLTVRQAAAELGIGRSKVYELIANGERDVIHIGRTTRIPPDAVTDLIRRARRAHGSWNPQAWPNA